MSTIVIFDGVCNLCNSAVDFILRHDRTDEILFASFQGERGSKLLREHGVFDAPHTVYVVHNGELFMESAAVLFLAHRMRPWWIRLFGSIASIIPVWLANAVYRWVARNRYRWFGRRSSCRLPTQAEASRFLDR